MDLPIDLLSQFAKVTNDDNKPVKESTVYGVAVKENDKLYVKIDGSDLLTPASSTVNVQPGERVTVMLKNHSAVITGNMTSPSARIEDVSTFEVSINDASKTATNFLLYESSGLQIGNKSTGVWNGFRTRITNDSFDILDSSGNLLASYGRELVELGKDSNDAIISLCADEGKIEFKMDPDTGEEYLQVVSDKLRLKSSEMSSLYSTYTDDKTRWEKSAANVSPTQIHLYASKCIDSSMVGKTEGWNVSDIFVNSDGIIANTPGEVSITSDDDISINAKNDVSLIVSNELIIGDKYGRVYTVETGSSGIWRYEKRSDGYLEMWGSYSISNLACSTALGNMYRTAAVTPGAFPFNVYDPNLVASYESDGYGSMLWATTATTSSNPPSYYLVRPTSATITSGKINFQVRGRWFN